MILGCAGAGKTTLARQLGERIAAPVICLDAIWRREWSAADVPKFRALVAEAHAGETWVSDGNFAQATFDLRLPRADLVVWVSPPRWKCAWRAATRVFAPGEAHRLADLPKVLAFIWRFKRVNTPLIETLRLTHGPHVPLVRLTSNAEIARFVTTLA